MKQSQSIQPSTDISQTNLDTLDELRAAVPFAGRDLFLVSGAHAVIHALTVLMPLIYPLIQAEYHLSYTQIGLIVAIPNAIGGFLQITCGLLSRFILRKVMLGVGNILVGVSTFFTGTIIGFWSLMFWSTLARIAGVPQHPVGSSYLTDRYGRRRHGYALAWHVAGGNIGTLAVPLIAGPLLGLWGWRPLLYVAALPGILFGVAILLFLEERNVLDRRTVRGPQAEAIVAGYEDGNKQDWKANLLALVQPLRSRTVVIIMAVSIIAAGGRGLGNVTTYVPLYLQNVRHLSGTTISIFFTLLLIGSVLGPLLGGRLSDWVGRRLMLLIFYGASALTTILFLYVAAPGMPVWIIPLSLILMGFAVYAESPLLQAYLADSASPQTRDSAFALYFTLAFGVGSAWSGILGWVIDQFGFSAAFWTMALSYLASGLLLLFIRSPRRG
jgi:MFS family permease